MIIWSGWGFLVAIILFINSFIGELLCRYITGNNEYYQQNSWPLTVVLILTGVICWFLGKYLNKPNDKVYIDKQTGKEVRLSKTHKLFFIKMEYWGPILVIIGLVNLFVR
ncbi:hypothetical protein [Clostridium arbusti]|uniref:hypothetical protein n=1 Tax=Clostridium arbusti TaxID=1137848 RepID=UPI000289683F|nr:hypothetical protein [Clostridium arbusti]